jgi:hypothetical protein
MCTTTTRPSTAEPTPLTGSLLGDPTASAGELAQDEWSWPRTPRGSRSRPPRSRPGFGVDVDPASVPALLQEHGLVLP